MLTMFFRRRPTAEPPADPYTALPKGPHYRTRRTSTPIQANPKPRVLIKPRSSSVSTGQKVPASPSSHQSQSAASTTTAHSYAGVAQPYPRGYVQHNRFTSLPVALPAEIQVQIDIERDRRARAYQAVRPVGRRRHIIKLDDPPRQRESGVVGYNPSPVQWGPPVPRSPSLRAIGAVPESLRPSWKPEPKPSPLRSSKRAAVPPDPRRVFEELERLLSLPSATSSSVFPFKSVQDHLDLDDLLAIHERDLMDLDMMSSVRAGLIPVSESEEALSVFGVPLRKVLMYASQNAVLCEKEHPLPIVVYNCVEELYRTGLYQPDLFRALPNRPRLLKLISIFDSQRTQFGRRIGIGDRRVSAPECPRAQDETLLCTESTADVCALLSTYITSLPEPVLIPELFDAIWIWCVLASGASLGDPSSVLTSMEEADARRFHTFPRRAPLRLNSVLAQANDQSRRDWRRRKLGKDKAENEAEETRIKIAQTLLRLLPSANFSLMVYLLAFFSQVGMMCGENGMGFEDLGRMFGSKVFGSGGQRCGARADERVGEATQAGGKCGDVMLCWFLDRWGEILEGLDSESWDASKESKGKCVENLETSSDGFVDAGIRKPGSDVDSASDYGSANLSPDEIVGRDPARGAPGDLCGSSPSLLTPGSRFGVLSPWSEEPSEMDESEIPGDAKGGLAREKNKENEIESVFELGSDDSVVLLPSNIKKVVQVDASDQGTSTSGKLQRQRAEADAASLYSSAALDERLLTLDLLPPTEKSAILTLPLNVKKKSHPASNSDDDRSPTPNSRETLKTTLRQLDEANQYIAALERELERNDVVVTDAIQETFRARERTGSLEKRVKELEGRERLLDDWSNASVALEEQELKRRLEVAVLERDDAWKVVAEIRKLMPAGWSGR